MADVLRWHPTTCLNRQLRIFLAKRGVRVELFVCESRHSTHFLSYFSRLSCVNNLHTNNIAVFLQNVFFEYV